MSQYTGFDIRIQLLEYFTRNKTSDKKKKKIKRYRMLLFI